MITLFDAYKILDKVSGDFFLTTENIKVKQSFGRVLARDQQANLTLPPFNKSAMDGYAILAGDDGHDVYQVLELAAAGEMKNVALFPGATMKVMTGAPVPPGSGKVIPREFTEELGDTIKVIKRPNTSNICYQGEDVKPGDLIVKKGAKVGAIELANLIGCGIESVEVFASPKCMIISTGDEIVDDVREIQPGKIMNINGPMLRALCERNNLAVIAEISVKDDYAEMSRVLQDALRQADIILLSGGVSMGDFDFVKQVIAASLAQIHFNNVAIKPGKPVVFASGNNKLIFGFPGNPVAVYITFQLFLLRALDVIYGRSGQRRDISLPLAQDFKRKKADRAEYVPCKILEDGSVIPVEFHGSGHLSALLACDGFFVVERNIIEIAAKTPVLFIGK